MGSPARNQRTTSTGNGGVALQITGVVEDGTGRNSATVDPATLTALGYTPHRGTLNIRVAPSARAKVMALEGCRIDGVTYWDATLDGVACHVRVSRDPRTLEIVHRNRLRDRLVNGDKVTLQVTGRKPMRLSAAIMAHPVRAEHAERVQAALDRPVPIVYDENPVPSADKMQRWVTGRRCWESADSAADWHLVIQDDVLVSRNLLASLERALQQLGPEGLVSAYTGTGRPDQKNVIRALAHAEAKGHSWMSTRSLNWGPAILLPRSVIPDMLEWCERHIRRNGPPRSNYDYAIGVYARDQLGWRTWYTVPSLVEHRGLPSLVGHDSGPVRVAHRFHDGDALDIDWTRTPPCGLPVRL